MVILLAALSVHRVGFGLLLVGTFSLGLGAMLFAIGSLVVTLGARIRPRHRGQFSLRVLPVAGAVAVTGIGLAIAVAGAEDVLAQRASPRAEVAP
jgi:hypothetical protein